ncbi:MAG: translocation/assembly module TamB domain-containing protein [Anaerolineae bacterium]
MTRFLTKIFHLLAMILMALLLLLSFFFAALQTPWAKKKLLDYLVDAAHKKGILLSIGEISGSLPFQWTIQDLKISLKESEEFSFKTLKLRIAFFPLLANELCISYLRCDESTFAYLPIHRGPYPKLALLERFSEMLTFSLPFSLSINTFNIADLSIENKASGSTGRFALQGNGFIQKKLRDFKVDLKMSHRSYVNSQAEVLLSGGKRKEHIAGRVKLKVISTEALKPLMELPFDSDFFIHLTLDGPWDTWASLAKKDYLQSLPLQGLLKAQVHAFDWDVFRSLNQKWQLDSLFSLSSDLHLIVEKFNLESPLMQLLAKGALAPGLKLQDASAVFCLPSLSLFNADLKEPLQGMLKGEAVYADAQASLKLSTEGLKIGKIPFEIDEAKFNAQTHEKLWTGDVDIKAHQGEIPIEFHCAYETLHFSTLGFKDLSLQGPDAKISGALSLDLSQKLIEGTLFAQVLHLNRFKALTPFTLLDGSLGGELRFFTEKNAAQISSSSSTLFLTLQHLQIDEGIANDITLSTHLNDLFGKPKGSIALEAEKIFRPEFYLSSFSLISYWENGRWPFDLQIQGTWKEPLEVQASGRWGAEKLEGPSSKYKSLSSKLAKEFEFSILLDKFSGKALGTYFSLENPFSFHISPELFFLEPCQVKLKDGLLFIEANLDKTAAKVHFKGDHVPLDLLSLWYPSFSFNGTSSVEAYLDASKENIQGRLSFILDHTDLHQLGKTAPLKAKGSLQAHLNQKTLQVHADLLASHDQFLDWKATLPIDYTLFPLTLRIDDQRTLSSELTMEGNLEEIFDFVDMGSHRMAGLLSCHLFLSKTFLAPSISGTIELQKGSYDNFYTGTALKEIQAKLLASNDELKIQSLVATDGQSGSLNAHGQLFLKPKDKFPYFIQADLLNLNMLRFDRVTSKFSGPLQLKGTSESAAAIGNLQVTRADLAIPDQLHINVPELPITYINQPSSLKNIASEPKTIFPLHLDLKLGAEGQIFVRGRGLSSEWKGNLSLSGTNTDITAAGALNLLKGEFVFSGKVFTLTQGEISFTKKPKPTAFLSLSGTLALPQATVIVMLRGPLTSPQLTFQSVPHMPTSSILSYILFNKDVSDISPMQAIQLAQMVMTISGGAGPDVLEAIRKSLGVDRLNIVSGSGGSDQISVQIGKYLTRGVMVTLTQSAESSQVVVEVELAKGFILQAETENEGEGKFSIKWNRNY